MKKIMIIFVVAVGILSTLFYMYNRKNTSKETITENKKNTPEKEIKEKELFEDYYEDALAILKTMTLEEEIGQLFLVRYDKNSAIDEISNYYTGGYVLFAKDFEYHTKESIYNEIKNLQEISKYPLVIAVDEEGGSVTRVSRFKNFRSEKFLSPRDIYD